MYNPEQKERYLNEASGKYTREYITNVRSLFNRTEQLEEILGKDLCSFSRSDISNLYSIMKYSDRYTYSSINSKLISYVDWCAFQSLIPDGCNHFKEFVIDDFDNYINTRIIANKLLTREDLMQLLSDIPNPRDQFLVLCLFEFGKSPDFREIFEMKLEDINMEEKTVTLVTGRTVHVSDKLIKIAIDANESDSYYNVLQGTTKKYEPSEYIFKRVYNGRDNNSSINVNNKLVARIIKNLVDLYGGNVGINASSIALSGQLDMIRRRANDLGIDRVTYIKQYYETELGHQYIMSPPDVRRFLKKYQAYI